MTRIYYMNYCGNKNNILDELKLIDNFPSARVLDRSLLYLVVIEAEELQIEELLASLPDWNVTWEPHEFRINSPLPIAKIAD